jgi:hypothetical protein
MAMTPYGGDPLVISKLGTTPQERGLNTEQFKAKFDEGLKEFVTWFNSTHKTEFDAHLADNAYIAPTLLNGWENFGSLYITAGYIKDAHGYVYLRGFIKSGATAINTILFQLPGGYRPGAQHLFPQVSKGATTAIQINVDGNVLLGASTTSADWLSLSGIVFKAGG